MMIHYKLFNSSHCEFLLFNGSICNIQHSTEGRLATAYYASFGIKRFIYQSTQQVELSGALEYHCHMHGTTKWRNVWFQIVMGYVNRIWNQTPYRSDRSEIHILISHPNIVKLRINTNISKQDMISRYIVWQLMYKLTILGTYITLRAMYSVATYICINVPFGVPYHVHSVRMYHFGYRSNIILVM